MNPLEASNPFTVLTFIAAPAVLTNASSVLALGTSNRFARARVLSQKLEEKDSEEDPLTPMRIRHLNRTEQRSILLLQALRTFYTALGSFAAAALISILGVLLASSAHQSIFRAAQFLALISGFVGVGGLIFGCSLLVHETRLAVFNVSEEAALLRERYKRHLPPPPNAGEPG